MERYENTETYAFVSDMIDDFEDITGRVADREEAHALETIWNMDAEDLAIVCWLLNTLDEERGGRQLLEQRMKKSQKENHYD